MAHRVSSMRTAGVVVAFLAAFFPAFASAQAVMVLGVRSVEGDDEFARSLTGAIRHEATQIAGWNVSEREVTLAQMALVHDCDDPQPACLGEIANSLSVARIIYGDVRRTRQGSNYDFSVHLHHFDAQSGTIEQSVVDTIPSARTDIDDLREPARRWIASLSGAPRVGTLAVQVNVPGAEVLIDGRSVGTADSDGALSVEGVEEGTRQVRVTARGYSAFTASVSVEAYAEASLQGELAAGGGGGGGGGASVPVELIAGIALLAVAAGAGVGWAYSGVTVLDRNSSDEWEAARMRYGTSIPDICAVHSGGMEDVQAICDEVSTLEILQFVFMGVTVIAGGVGAYLLIAGLTSGGDESEEESAGVEFELVPSIGLEHAYLGARVRF